MWNCRGNLPSVLEGVECVHELGDFALPVGVVDARVPYDQNQAEVQSQG